MPSHVVYLKVVYTLSNFILIPSIVINSVTLVKTSKSSLAMRVECSAFLKGVIPLDRHRVCCTAPTPTISLLLALHAVGWLVSHMPTHRATAHLVLGGRAFCTRLSFGVSSCQRCCGSCSRLCVRAYVFHIRLAFISDIEKNGAWSVV